MIRIFLILNMLLSGSIIMGQTICIDPGHGIGDFGEDVDGRSTEEITTNVDVGLILRDTLENRGYTVILTRENSDTGSWMSLTQRAELADFYESDRLLSIHCNAGGGTGTETFWSRRNTKNHRIDSTFSLLVQKNMVKFGEWTNRRSIEDKLYLGYQLGVLKGSTPGCLSEIGFVDKPSDLEKLLDELWRSKFAHAYALAIKESFEINYPTLIKESDIVNSISPNPFKSEISVKLSNQQSVTHIQLTSLDGKILYRATPEAIFTNKIVISTEEFKQGIYYLTLFNTSGSKTYALIKY